MRKFYYELDGDENDTYLILEEGGGEDDWHVYDLAWCWVTEEQDAKDLVTLLHKLQGTKESC